MAPDTSLSTGRSPKASGTIFVRRRSSTKRRSRRFVGRVAETPGAHVPEEGRHGLGILPGARHQVRQHAPPGRGETPRRHHRLAALAGADALGGAVDEEMDDLGPAQGPRGELPASNGADRVSRVRLDAGALLLMGRSSTGAGRNRRRWFAHLTAGRRPGRFSSGFGTSPPSVRSRVLMM